MKERGDGDDEGDDGRDECNLAEIYYMYDIYYTSNLSRLYYITYTKT